MLSLHLYSSGLLLRAALLCLGLKPSLLVPMSVSRTSPVPQLLLSIPTAQVHPAAPTALPARSAALSSGLGATETVTWNLNMTLPLRDQGASPGLCRPHAEAAGQPGTAAPCRELGPGLCAHPGCRWGEARDIPMLTFEVTPFSPTGIPVATPPAPPVRAALGLLLDMKSLCVQSPRDGGSCSSGSCPSGSGTSSVLVQRLGAASTAWLGVRAAVA